MIDKHTPGPWRAMSGGLVAGHDPQRPHSEVAIAHVSTWVTHINADPMQEANARLIASAPTLLDALREAQAWFEAHGPNGGEATYSAIHKAIAAATGE